MNKTRKSILSGLLALCMALSLMPAPVLAAEPQPAETANITTYIPQGETGAENAHTIHWALGITPPSMPGQTVSGKVLSPEEADFTLIDANGNPVTHETNKTAYEYYVAPYQNNMGWYDINKYYLQDGIDDLPMCFAVAASNLLQWWMDRNSDYIYEYLQILDSNPEIIRDDLGDPHILKQYMEERPQVTQNPATSSVYNLILKAYRSISADGGHSNYPIDTFMNGYMPSLSGPNNKEHFRPYSEGGLFYPVFGESILSFNETHTTYKNQNSKLKEYLDSGLGIVLGYYFLSHNDGHAVTLWGAEYDENDNLCALYITDNNDTGDLSTYYRDWSGQTHTASMLRYDAYAHAATGLLTMGTTKEINTNSGSEIFNMYLLSPATEGWEHFIREKTPLYPDGRPFLSHDEFVPIPGGQDSIGDPDCSHSYHYRAEGSRIIATCDKCSYCQWLELKPRMGADYTYQGGAQVKPYSMFPSSQWRRGGNISYSNNTEAGTATVTMSYGGIKVTQQFTINPAPQDAPAQPELVSRTGSTITLKADSSLEYRMEGGTWQTDNVFSGLQPETSYTFYARKAGSRNYLPSDTSAGVSFQTADSSIPPEPREYTVHFDANGGTASAEKMTTTQHTLEVLPTASRDGRDFLGWFTALSGGTEIKNGHTFTASVTLYAHWSEEKPLPPEALTGTLSVQGAAKYGQTLSAVYENGNAPAVRYQWYRGASPIPGAEDAQYTLTRDDIAQKISVKVIAGGNFTGTLTSNSVIVSKADAPVLTEGPYHTIDFTKETVSAHSGYEFQKGTSQAASCPAVPGETLRLRAAETDTCNASDWISIQIPGRPAFDASVVKATDDGRLTGVSAAMEYQIGNGLWLNGDGEDITGQEKGTVIRVRLKATASAFASDAQSFTIRVEEKKPTPGPGPIIPGPSPVLPDPEPETPDGSSVSSETLADGTKVTTTTLPDGSCTLKIELSSETVKKGGSILLPLPALPVGQVTAEIRVPASVSTRNPVRVVLPVKNAGFGTAAVLVEENGSAQIIRKSILRKEGLSFPIDGSATVRMVDNTKHFQDASAAWYRDAVTFVTSHEIFDGTAPGTFAPTTATTRGMLAKVLHNLESNPAPVSSGGFTDIAPGTWYTDAVNWAAEKGIVNGYGSRFAPEDTLTREQLVTMLYRYAGQPDFEHKALLFRDSASVSAWAENAMQWAVQTGLVNGVDGGLLAPQGQATRAQMATILMRFCESFFR